MFSFEPFGLASPHDDVYAIMFALVTCARGRHWRRMLRGSEDGRGARPLDPLVDGVRVRVLLALRHEGRRADEQLVRAEERVERRREADVLLRQARCFNRLPRLAPRREAGQRA